MRVRLFLLLISFFLLWLCDLSAQTGAKIKKLEGKLKSVSSGEEVAIRLRLASLYRTSDIAKALDNANRSLAGAKKIRNNNAQADACGIMGEIYDQQNDQKNALKYYEAELELREKMPATEHFAKLNYTVASIYRSQDKLRRAAVYFEKSLSTAKNLGIKQLIFTNYEALFNTCYDQGNYKEAMGYFKLYMHIRDSSSQVKKSKEISEMVSHFEVQKQKKDIQIGELNELTGKQQLEIRTQELEISRKNMERNFLIAVLCFILMAIFLLFSLYSSKKKANIRLAGQNAEIQTQKEEIESQRDEIASQLHQLGLLNKALEQQKEEIIAQRDEIEEKSSIIELKNTDITKSIEYALRIQQAILPTAEEIAAVFPESFVLYKPKDIVSGDFYWIATVPGNRTFIAAVDCTGHGVPGGFMSMIGVEKLNDIVSQTPNIRDLHPAQILNLLDKEIKKTLRQTGEAANLSDGMDMALCEFNFNSGKVWYAGANRPLWLIKSESGEVIEYPAVKKGIGETYEHELEYENQLLNIGPDDMIYIFSDGYEDQFGGERKRKLMKKNMGALFSSMHHLTPVQQYEYLENYFSTWKKGEIQVDDVLVVGIRYKYNS